MSEKDIKTKPKTTTKAVQNAPKSVSRSPAETVKDIKTAAKDTLVRNAVDKQLETRQSNEPQRAEVEAFIKEDMAQRQARHDKLQKMTPEQRQAIRANRPLKVKDGKHFKHHNDGKHFQGEGFHGHGPRPDCKIAICPPAPAK